jgi:hypothetical protein
VLRYIAVVVNGANVSRINEVGASPDLVGLTRKLIPLVGVHAPPTHCRHPDMETTNAGKEVNKLESRQPTRMSSSSSHIRNSYSHRPDRIAWV